MLRLWLIIATLVMAPSALAQRPAAVVPSDAGVVIERLPRGYARLMPSATAPAPIAQVTALLATAAQTGDARLAARADALLSRIPLRDQNPDVLRARAFSAQHHHDFAGAVKLLDALIAHEPRDGAARLSRAQINLVRGRLDLARADCAALVLGIDAGSGMLCVAMLALRNGQYPTAAATLDRWLQANTRPESQRHGLVMRAEVAARAGDRADAWFRRALALAPEDVRTLAAYARYLRAAGLDREVETLLADAPDHDGLHLQRTLAAYRIDPTKAAALVAAQARRYATAHAVGSTPEMRDEAEFLLRVRDDPAAALLLAQRNFQSQRDYEDVDLLHRAAVAAHRPDALRPLQAWAQSQRLSLPPLALAVR